MIDERVDLRHICRLHLWLRGYLVDSQRFTRFMVFLNDVCRKYKGKDVGNENRMKIDVPMQLKSAHSRHTSARLIRHIQVSVLSAAIFHMQIPSILLLRNEILQVCQCVELCASRNLTRTKASAMYIVTIINSKRTLCVNRGYTRKKIVKFQLGLRMLILPGMFMTSEIKKELALL